MTNPELEYEVAGGFVRIVFRRPMIIGSDRDDSRDARGQWHERRMKDEGRRLKSEV